MYLVKTPWWLKALYPQLTWHIETSEKIIYLTFDDGPHPEATPFVLDVLNQYRAKATFFCIGKNVKKHPSIYQEIIANQHAVGNHTQHHLNGWQTDTYTYVKDILWAANFIQSNLFRPPYGRITKSQIKEITIPPYINAQTFSPIMWSVLSGDFDISLSNEKCLDNVLKNTTSGSIVVFHDSEKAFQKLQYALPKMLEHFSNLDYQFHAINA